MMTLTTALTTAARSMWDGTSTTGFASRGTLTIERALCEIKDAELRRRACLFVAERGHAFDVMQLGKGNRDPKRVARAKRFLLDAAEAAKGMK